jgi:predicted signal transduction protein with EAL and GGDEF domain
LATCRWRRRGSGAGRRTTCSPKTNTALLGGERKKVTTSIGVAMFNTSVEELTGETIVIEADLAMYEAKEAGGDGHAFYATSEHRVSRTKARLTWVSRIEQALEEDRFALLAQPILDLTSRKRAVHRVVKQAVGALHPAPTVRPGERPPAGRTLRPPRMAGRGDQPTPPPQRPTDHHRTPR